MPFTASKTPVTPCKGIPAILVFKIEEEGQWENIHCNPYAQQILHFSVGKHLRYIHKVNNGWKYLFIISGVIL